MFEKTFLFSFTVAIAALSIFGRHSPSISPFNVAISPLKLFAYRKPSSKRSKDRMICIRRTDGRFRSIYCQCKTNKNNQHLRSFPYWYFHIRKPWKYEYNEQKQSNHNICVRQNTCAKIRRLNKVEIFGRCFPIIFEV